MTAQPAQVIQYELNSYNTTKCEYIVVHISAHNRTKTKKLVRFTAIIYTRIKNQHITYKVITNTCAINRVCAERL